MAKGEQEKAIFRPGGAQKLLEGISDDLTNDEQALLLALINADTELGETLDDSERAALEKLEAAIEGYDPEEVAQAVKHVISAKPNRGRKLKWPELNSVLQKIRSSKG